MPVGEVDCQRFGAGDSAIHIVEEDIVVAAALHLAEVEFHLLGSETVDIDELGIELIIPACNYVGESVGRIERSQHGYAEQNCMVMKSHVAGYRLYVRLARIYDIVYLAFVHQLDYFVVGRKARNFGALETEAPYYICRALCSIKRKTEVGKLLDYIDYLVLILVVYGEVNARGILLGGMLHVEACRNKSLEERLFHSLAYAEDFARRLHLGSELRVDVVELFKRENGHLYCDIG